MGMGEEEGLEEGRDGSDEGSEKQRIATLQARVQALEVELRTVTIERDDLKAERDTLQTERDLVVISSQQIDQQMIQFTTTYSGFFFYVVREYARPSRVMQYYRDLYERVVPSKRREPTFLQIESVSQGRTHSRTKSRHSHNKSESRETSTPRRSTPYDKPSTIENKFPDAPH